MIHGVEDLGAVEGDFRDAVVGFDDHDLAEAEGLTTVRQDIARVQTALTERRASGAIFDVHDKVEDADAEQRLLREAQAMARLNHPNVVQVFDVDEAEGRPFYSMELLTESLQA